MDSSARSRWLAQILELALREGVLSEDALLGHASPDMLAEHLPEEVLGEVLNSALEVGELSPQGVLDSASPDVLASCLPHDVLWSCVVKAAIKAGISEEG